MPPTRRIRSGEQPAGAGGGGPGTTPTISWGPDFGESNGADGVTRRVGVQLTMPSLAAEYNKSVGVAPRLTALEAIYNAKSVGVHLSGTALGAPFWQAVETANPGGGSSITVNVPAGKQSQDLLLAFISTQGTLSVPTVNTPSGWTASATAVQGVTNRISTFWKISDGTEVSQAFTLSAAADIVAGEIHLIRGVDQTTPINITASGNASVTDPVVPSVTTTEVNCLVFYAVCHNHGALTQSHTPPASNTERTDFESVNVTRLGETSGTRIFAASGSTGTATVDCNQTLASAAAYVRIAVAPGTITLAA